MSKTATFSEQTVPESTILFKHNSVSSPILELRHNGDIFVKGKLIENDIEVVEALRELIKLAKS